MDAVAAKKIRRGMFGNEGGTKYPRCCRGPCGETNNANMSRWENTGTFIARMNEMGAFFVVISFLSNKPINVRYLEPLE
jgi:hypothetical protein